VTGQRRGWAGLASAAELAPGLAVVLLVGLLFVPVGPAVVDALVAASLGISAVVLLATLLAPDALRLSAFPALLLLTTLLRLAVAVASTRLVLSRGEAGRVIESLGRVVMQGSWVAGAVVYAILALVQLLVVSRGAERVAEVAARFTLDALPGKQMAIDAELRAGAIDAAEAGRRRRALERESQLHGAMDGALKFVKGDAVAGIAIALVNAVGGLAAGVLRGMTPGRWTSTARSAWLRWTSSAWPGSPPDRPVTRSPALPPPWSRRKARAGRAPSDRSSTLGPGRLPRPTPRSGDRPTCSSGSRRCRRCSTPSSPRPPRSSGRWPARFHPW
jgi:hypothetical protein